MTALPLPTNSTGIVHLGSWVNSATEGFFWLSILMTITIISFTYMSRFGFSRAAASSLFFSILLALPLRFLGYIGDMVLFTYGILLAASVVLLFLFGEQ